MTTPILRLRILCIEDDDVLRCTLEELLVEEGYDVVAKASAEEGLAELQHERYDLVLSDNSLPGRTGSWMLETARAEHRLDDTAALMLTGDERARLPSWVRVLQKPVDVDTLFAEVSRALDAQAQREPAATFDLFVSGRAKASVRAARNLQALVARRGASRVRVRLVDVCASADAPVPVVLFTPTLVVTRGGRRARFVGDLSDASAVERFLHEPGVDEQGRAPP